MDKSRQLEKILAERIIAVVRSRDSDKLVEVAKALVMGGVRTLEITMTVPDALEVIRAVRRQLGDEVLLGAGTILDPETARAALLAGAEFIVGPTVQPDVICLCRRYNKPVFPGAFTPTEVLAAWEQGADIVKVFPAEIGGPDLLRAIKGPLPQIPLMPTGGVNLKTAEAFLRAGAACLGLGSALVDKDAVAAGDMKRITLLAEQYVQIIRAFEQRN